MIRRQNPEKKRRNFWIVLSICIVVLLCVVILAVRYTPFFGKYSAGVAYNDSIGINAMCTNVSILKSEDVKKILDDKEFDGVKLSDKQLRKIKNANSDLCVADIVYKIYNYTGKTFDKINIKVDDPKSSSMSAYFSSALKIKDDKNNEEITAYQRAIISTDSVDKEYFDINLEEPEDFYANLKYKLEYSFEDSDDDKEMTYVTVSRKRNGNKRVR